MMLCQCVEGRGKSLCKVEAGLRERFLNRLLPMECHSEQSEESLASLVLPVFGRDPSRVADDGLRMTWLLFRFKKQSLRGRGSPRHEPDSRGSGIRLARPRLIPLLHLLNLGRLGRDDVAGQGLQLGVFGLLRGLLGHRDSTGMVRDHRGDKAYVVGLRPFDHPHCAHVHRHAAGWFEVWIPLFAPYIHLIDLGLLRLQNRLGQLLDFWLGGLLLSVFRHLNCTLMMLDHAVDKQGIKRRVCSGGAMIHAGHAAGGGR